MSLAERAKSAFLIAIFVAALLGALVFAGCAVLAVILLWWCYFPVELVLEARERYRGRRL